MNTQLEIFVFSYHDISAVLHVLQNAALAFIILSQPVQNRVQRCIIVSYVIARTILLAREEWDSSTKLDAGLNPIHVP